MKVDRSRVEGTGEEEKRTFLPFSPYTQCPQHNPGDVVTIKEAV